MAFRVTFSIIALVALFFVPFWGVGLIVVAGYAIFDGFYEGMAVGFLFDLLYNPGLVYGIPFMSFFMSAVGFFIIMLIKNLIRKNR